MPSPRGVAWNARPPPAGTAPRHPQLSVPWLCDLFRYVGDAFEVVDILEGHRDVDAWFQADEDE
jgi:hypothetical protein